MDNVKCPECGKEVEDGTKKCPDCGYPLVVEKKKSKKVPIIFTIIILLIAAALVIFVILPKYGFSVIGGKPIPFASVEWNATQDEVIADMGEPLEEYENEYYGHIINYENIEYEGYTGSAKFCFESGKLTRVMFHILEYDEDIYNYFYDMYEAKYGEPDFSNEFGARWDNRFSSVGIGGSSIGKGMMNCIFLSPDISSEQ